MLHPTITKRAKIVRSFTIKGIGYKVRLQQKNRLEPDGSPYDFILVRWLDPKTNQTVNMHSIVLKPTIRIAEYIKAILTPEALAKCIDWLEECKPTSMEPIAE